MSDFNSKQFEWSDVSVGIGGKIIEGCSSVKYTKKRVKEALMGRGSKPHAIQRGNHEYEGELVLWQSEYTALENATTDGDILNAEFDITVAYTPADGGATKIQTLKSAQVKEAQEGLSQGDTHGQITLPIIFRDIKLQ